MVFYGILFDSMQPIEAIHWDGRTESKDVLLQTLLTGDI